MDVTGRCRSHGAAVVRAVLILALLAVPGCSWSNIIVLVYVWDRSPSSPVQLPSTINRADGSVFEGRPVPDCQGAIQYVAAGKSYPLLIARIRVVTSRIELASSSMDVEQYELITLSNGLNLPSGAIDEELLHREDVLRALRASDGLVRDLSSRAEFRGLLPSFVGKIVKGNDLAKDVREYCQR